MPILVRPVTLKDAAAIVDVLGPIVEAGTFTAMTGPVTEETQREFIQTLPERALYHLAERDTVVVGVQDVLPASASVGEVSTFVSLDSLRRGVGAALCEVTIPAARALGYESLRATIRSDNPEALAFYERQGFRVITRGEFVSAELALGRVLRT